MSVNKQNGLSARVDEAIGRAIAEKRIVGATVHVSKDGSIVHRRAYGLRDREDRAPMKEDTMFRIASLTKPITAVTALALVDEGTLDLTSPITRWLPNFRPLPSGAPAEITVRHLLTHTSGLSYAFMEAKDGPYHAANISDGLDQPGLSLEENLARLSKMSLAFPPGSAFLYSLAFDVLGAIIERATGEAFPDVVARVVTKPLEMHETAFFAKDPRSFATPYADGKPEPVRMHDGIYVPFAHAGATFAPSRAAHPKSYPSGGAGMVGNGDDFLKFLEAVRTRAPIAPKSWLDEMTRDQIPEIDSPILGAGQGYGYGVGVLRDPARAESPLSKGTLRWGGAYGHTWWIDPAAKISAVLLTNTAFEGMAGQLRTDVERALGGA
jgi:CubicO group peptidase (beta-lactamase class C family)